MSHRFMAAILSILALAWKVQSAETHSVVNEGISMILTHNGTAPTPDNFKLAEEGLLAQTGGKLALWSGRAATGFYHAYRLAMRRRPDVQAPEIIMPAMSCTTAANVAAMMGIKPRFADNSRKDTLDDTNLLNKIQERFTANTIAVVVIHLFGNVLYLDQIRTWCRANKLLFIEDPTQGLGGQYRNGEYLGSKGDVTLYSFNKTKIIEVGNGILIANSQGVADELETILTEEKISFPTLSEDERKKLALKYRDMHHSLVSVIRANSANIPVVSQSFLENRPEFQALFLRPVDPSIDLNAAWEALETSLAHRSLMVQNYFQRLSGFFQRKHIMVFFGGALKTVCWRFSLQIGNPNQQVALSEAVRKDGFHVSNLYWPVNQFFNPSDECPNANYLARRIINLWVDTSVNEDYVARCCESLIRHSEELL